MKTETYFWQVGKGLSKDAEAQKLAFQHWIEAVITFFSPIFYFYFLYLEFYLFKRLLLLMDSSWIWSLNLQYFF